MRGHEAVAPPVCADVAEPWPARVVERHEQPVARSPLPFGHDVAAGDGELGPQERVQLLDAQRGRVGVAGAEAGSGARPVRRGLVEQLDGHSVELDDLGDRVADGAGDPVRVERADQSARELEQALERRAVSPVRFGLARPLRAARRLDDRVVAASPARVRREHGGAVPRRPVDGKASATEAERVGRGARERAQQLRQRAVARSRSRRLERGVEL